MAGLRFFRTAAVAAGAVGGLMSAFYGLMMEQSRRARTVIGEPESPPLNADGVYLPDGTGPVRTEAAAAPLRFAVLGDSSAAGFGVDTPEELPGTLLARGLAEEAGRPVLLTTYAIVGAVTPDLAEQVDRALPDAPNVALVIIGANDVAEQLKVHTSAALLAVEVHRLRDAGVAVVVGTCPDLGAIRPIPQPLRSLARAWSLLLARAQKVAVAAAGGIPVALADLLSPEFVARPDELFSADRFHPNGAGYDAAASVLLAPVCVAAGVGSAWAQGLGAPDRARTWSPARLGLPVSAPLATSAAEPTAAAG